MEIEKRLVPLGKQVTLEELAPGTIFAFGDDCIAVKSEYRASNGLIEAFIIDSGEQFWGGAKTVEEQLSLMVQPLKIVEAVEKYKGAKDGTLQRMKKADLISYIRFLERRCNRINSFIERQAKEFRALMKERCDKCLKTR